MSRRIAAPLVLLFLFLIFSSTLRAQRSATLQPGVSHTHAIGRNQSYWFTVALEEGDCAEIVVDQRGVDVMVRVTGPDQRVGGDYDSPYGGNGRENVPVAAPVAGTYTITILPVGMVENTGGQFDIRLSNVRRATALELQEARRPDILKAKGIEILHRLADMIPQLRSRPTRLNMQMQLAQTLWEVDEKLARRLVMDAVSDIREYLQEPQEEDSPHLPPNSRAQQLRTQMFSTLLPHDAEFALTFIRETRFASVDVPQYAGQPDQEVFMETQVGNLVARKQPKRAFEIAQEALNRGYSAQLGGVITNLRSVQPELAAALTKQATARLQDDNLLATPEAANLAINLLQTARAPREDVALLSDFEYRELFAKTLAAGLGVTPILNVNSRETAIARTILTSLKGMADDLGKLEPATAAAIEEKLAQLTSVNNTPDRAYREAINNGSVDVAFQVIGQAPIDFRDNLYFQLANRVAATGDVPRAREIATGMITNPSLRRQALDNVERVAVQQAINSDRLYEVLEGLTRLRGQRERLNVVNQIVFRIEQQNLKTSAAANFLEQVLLVADVSNPPVGTEQANAVTLIARAFARYDAGRGFQMIEPFLNRFNELAEAARTLNGFGQQYYENGELDFNNGNFVGHLATQLGETLARLSVHDPDRARSAIERLELLEVRASALLAMARQLINPSPARGFAH